MSDQMPDEECPESKEGTVHCDHWYDDEAPCCWCLDDTGAGEHRK